MINYRIDEQTGTDNCFLGGSVDFGNGAQL
jgi:hypothetical protein